MALHPEVAAYRAARAAAGTPPLYTQTLAEARAADLAAIRAGGGAVEPVARGTRRADPRPGRRPAAAGVPAGRVGPAAHPAVLLRRRVDARQHRHRRRHLPSAGQRRALPGDHRRLPARPGAPLPGRGARLPRGRLRGSPGTPTSWASTRPGWRSAGTAPAGTWPPRSPCSPARDGGPRSPRQLLVYPNTDQSGEPTDRDDDDPTLFNSRSVAWYRTHYLADPATPGTRSRRRCSPTT